MSISFEARLQTERIAIAAEAVGTIDPPLDHQEIEKFAYRRALARISLEQWASGVSPDCDRTTLGPIGALDGQLFENLPLVVKLHRALNAVSPTPPQSV